MKRNLILLIVITLFFNKAYSNDTTKTSLYYVEKMQKGNIFYYSEIAHKLLAYDHIAWISTDSLMIQPQEELMKLGKEWFCYNKNNTWYAVYGKFSNNRFNAIFQFKYDTAKKEITRLREVEDDSILHLKYACAINNAYSEAGKDSISDIIRYNHYVFIDSLDRVNVIILPSFQRDGKAVFGNEFWYIFNSQGTKLIEKNVYLGKLRYYYPDKTKEITIDYSDFESPPVAALFYVLYYQHYFKSITIKTKDMYHFLLDGIWVSKVFENEK